MIEFGFGGLSNTLEKGVIGPNRAHWSYNCSTGAGVAQAWPGMSKFWARSGIHASDICYGAGYGRWGGTDEILVMLKRNGTSALKLYSIKLSDGSEISYTTDAWQNRTVEEWKFTQYENYVYGISPTDGVWRKELNNTAEGSWRRANTIFVDITSQEGQVTWDTPNPYYIAENRWNEGSWAGAASGDSDFDGIGTFTTGSASIEQGFLRISVTGDHTKVVDEDIYLGFTYTTPWDATEARYWYLEARVQAITDLGAEGTWSDTDTQEPYINPLVPIEVYFAEDNTAPFGDFTDAKWHTARVYASVKEIMPTTYGGTNRLPVAYGVSIDLDHLQFADNTPIILDSIKKFALKARVISGNDFTFTVSSPFQGGTFMSKPAYWNYMDGNQIRTTDPISVYGNQLEDIEYAITNYNSLSTAESSATFEVVDGREAVGAPYIPGTLPLGSRIRISWDAAPIGFDRTRIYRRRHSDGDKWYLIHQTSDGSSGAIIDARVDADRDVLDWAELSTYAADYDFGTAIANVNGTDVASWRGRLLILSDTEVYMSYKGRPTKFVKPLRDTGVGTIDTSDPGIGRTDYIASDIGDKGLCLVCQEAIYVVCERGIYYLLDPSEPPTAPYQLVPNSRGGLGTRSGCAYAGGLLVACRDGLFWYYATAAGVSPVTSDRLTKDIDATWRWLVQDQTDVVVMVHEDEILVTCGNRNLVRSRTGEWMMGERDATVMSTGGSSAAYDSIGTASAFSGTVYGISGAGGTGTTGDQNIDFSLVDLGI